MMTREETDYCVDSLVKLCASKQYWFPKETLDYNCFVFGLRSNIIDQSKDQFNDTLGVVYPIANRYYIYLCEGTTDPGVMELMSPSFIEAIRNGTAIVKEGQYRKVYKLGIHGTGNYKHLALLQQKPITIYRDSNRDKILDMKPIKTTEGIYGINLHGANIWNDIIDSIGRYSAGCQVIAKKTQYEIFFNILQKQLLKGLGDEFSYTLFKSTDFDDKFNSIVSSNRLLKYDT